MTATSHDDSKAIGRSDDLTRVVRALFVHAIGHDEFGDDDSFFLIGGVSASGLVVVRKLGEHVGTRMSLRDLLEHPTVRELAEHAVAAADRAADR